MCTLRARLPFRNVSRALHIPIALNRHGLDHVATRIAHVEAAIEIRVDDPMVRIADDAERVLPTLYLFDILEHGAAEQHNPLIRGAEMLGGPVRDDALRLPHHHVLGERPAVLGEFLELGLGMNRIGRILERRHIFDRRLVMALAAVFIAIELEHPVVGVLVVDRRAHPHG